METGRERWERRADGPLNVAALLFLAAWSWPILQPGLAPGWRHACGVTDWIVWALFALDYVVRLALSHERLRFVRGSLVDLLVIVLPIFRPLRLLRLVKLLGVFNQRAGTSMRGRVAAYVASSTVLVIYVASVAELDAERHAPGATITSFGDAIWWAMTTVTTVGYGDHAPVTATGEWIAAGLMISGIALLGVVSAMVASWLIQQVADEEEAEQRVTQSEVQLLLDEVRGLRTEIAELRARDGHGTDRTDTGSS